MDTRLASLSAPLATVASLHDAYLRSSSADSAAALDAVLAARPEDVDARLLRIAKLVVAKDLAAYPALERELAALSPLLAGASEDRRRHAQAAAHWLAHRPLHAAHVYSTICAKNPRDLLAVRLAQSCWYFLGRREKVRAVADRALPAWSRGDEGYDIALAMAAFGYDETGDAVRADDFAMRALDIVPGNSYAIHARAHALATAGSHGGVARFLCESAPHWRGGGRLESHIAWHLAASDLARGASDAAVGILRRDLLPLAARGPSAALDATDLAWRLELAGEDVGGAWEHLASCWAGVSAPAFWPPYDLLAGVAYIRARDHARLRELRAQLEAGPFVRRCAARASRFITLPALAAIESFARGSFARAEAELGATVRLMVASLLQRELFELTRAAARTKLALSATPTAASRIRA